MNEALAPQSVATPFGRIAYVRAGAGAPLLLLHGNGHSWHEFADVIAPLAARFDVIAWDMPGHGGSDDTTPTTSIKTYAAMLGAFIEALKLDRPAILGSSVGGVIAAAYGAAGGAASALILAETQFRTAEWWRKAWPMVEMMFGKAVQTRDQVQARLKRTLDEPLLDRWNRDRIRAGDNLMGVMDAIAKFDIVAALPQITVPTLLLFGEAGPTVDMADAMRGAMATAHITIVPDAGHFVSIDRPGIFAEAVTAFLNAAS